MANPYDDYDAIDPWDEDDGMGDFSYVEDEYVAMDVSDDEDPFASHERDPWDMSAAGAHARPQAPASSVPLDPTEDFPKTMVRPAYGELTRNDATEPHPPVTPPRGVLRRKPGAGRRVGETPPTREVAPAAVPSPQPVRMEPEPERRVPRRRRRRRGHGCLITLILLVAAIVGLYWLVAHPIDDELAFSAEEQKTLKGALSWSVPGAPEYVLALGSDAREGDTHSRTDTMVLMRVDLVGGNLTMVSVPRDTMVEIDGVGTAKINAAYAYGGAGGAVRAVSALVGVPVNHVAVIHFEQLVGLIDYLGGVSVNVPVGVVDPYTGLAIDAGLQTMDGATALAWARSRYGYAEGDFQRQADQRILIEAIMNRMLSLSPREVPGALAQLGGLVGTDMRCYNLVPLFVRFRLGSPTVYSCTLPTTSAYVGDQWYEVADEEALARLMRQVDAGGDPAVVV